MVDELLDTSYIANQGVHDEIRFLADMFTLKNRHGNNMPIALSGPPANGKTDVTEFFAKHVLGLDDREDFMFQIASQSDTRYDYSGMPLLVKGNSAFTKTPMMRVMGNKNGGIWYLDEIDQLPWEVQKDIVSVLDDRRVLPVTRIDKEGEPSVSYLDVENKDKFGIFMSYNHDPQNTVLRKFHPAFTSRFVEKAFKRLHPVLDEFLVYADDKVVPAFDEFLADTTRRSSDQPYTSEHRGIIFGKEGPIFLAKKDDKWYQADKVYKPKSGEKIKEYIWFDRRTPEEKEEEKTRIDSCSLDSKDFVHALITKYIPQVITVANQGTGGGNGGGARNINQFDLVPIDLRATRNVVNAYRRHVASGNYDNQTAQFICIENVVDNMLRGDLKEQVLDGCDARQFLVSLADDFIYGRNQGNTNL